MAARKGDAGAQAFLAMAHASGDFIVQDHLKAFYWASKSAAQGFPLAQLFVAKCYETGDGVERDDVLAYKWYLLAGRELQTLARQGILSCEERLTPGQRMEAQRMVRRHGQRGAAR